MAAFNEAAWQQLEEQMVAHLQDCFPVDYQLMGDKQARVFIRDGMARASRYGFERHGEICRFIDLRLALGSHILEDPMHPWARAALEQFEPGDKPDAQGRRLYQHTKRFLDEALTLFRAQGGTDQE